MQLTSYTDARRFLATAGEMLIAREAENNLILGTSGRLALRNEPDAEQYFATVADDDGTIVAAAMTTPPFPLVLTSAPDEAIRLIVEDLMARDLPFTGVLGRPGEALFAANLRQELAGGTFRKARGERIYSLDRVRPPSGIAGRLRMATEEDEPTIREWVEAFSVEIGEPGTPERIEKVARMIIAERRGHVWEVDRPVSMAAWVGPTPNGVRINSVYTPPELRGHGYASACVAALSQHLLDSGRRFCFLFTDLGNPTSNSIYGKMGYEPVGDVDLYRFTSATESAEPSR